MSTIETRHIMQITGDTKISEIFAEYGDISEAMMSLGMKGVDGNRLRRFLETKLTVKWAARFHRVPLDKFLELLHTATTSQGTEQS
ncbi:MAG: DUF1858 domain-containing protein [Lacisediminihabitans sp.]